MHLNRRAAEATHAAGGGRATNWALFAFAAVAPPAGSLPGPALRRLFEDLGLEPTAARVAIGRLRRAGRLESVRRGREADYTLAAPLRVLLADAVGRLAAQQAPWDGTLSAVLYSIPEPRRAYRDELRRRAAALGFGTLAPGLLVGPFDERGTRLDEFLAHAPAGSRILRPTLRFGEDEAHAAAALAWSLPAVARECRALAARMRDMAEHLANGSLTGTDAVRQLEATLSPFLALCLREPGLPRELAPAEWPLPELLRSAASLLGVARPWLRERLGVDHAARLVASRPRMPEAPDGICPICGKGPFVGAALYERHRRGDHRAAVLRAYERAVREAYQTAR